MKKIMTNTGRHSPLLTLLDDSGEVLSSLVLKGKTTFYIGRSEGNDIVLPFKWVSRQHAILQKEQSGALICIDLGSTNGTFINTKRVITPTPIYSGDLLAIGETTMVIYQETPSQKRIDKAIEEQTVSYSRKERVTILVTDIHGYTGLVESVGDQCITELLQNWAPGVNTIISEHEGMVDKFLGDAVMAVWIGGETCHNVRQALAAALAIDLLTRKLGIKTPGIGRELTTGSAINTGDAFIGNIGSHGRRDFTAIGDMINVAFRLQGLTTLTRMDFLLGEDAAIHVQDKGLALQHSRHLVKGREDEVSVYGGKFTDLAVWLRCPSATT
jgi:adenylate cyclase